MPIFSVVVLDESGQDAIEIRCKAPSAAAAVKGLEDQGVVVIGEPEDVTGKPKPKPSETADGMPLVNTAPTAPSVPTLPRGLSNSRPIAVTIGEAVSLAGTPSVRIAAIDVSFVDAMLLLIKWGFAAIPALIVVSVTVGVTLDLWALFVEALLVRLRGY
jgi:hypothetical protein